jgi:hypothetical protein
MGVSWLISGCQDLFPFFIAQAVSWHPTNSGSFAAIKFNLSIATIALYGSWRKPDDLAGLGQTRTGSTGLFN